MNDRRIVELDLNDILPNRFQPRIKFNEDSIMELADSIREHGVIQPIVVRSLGDRYEIIAGERRYKASVLAGRDTIPAIITELNDKDSAEVALIENVQRQDLTPIEEAISYRKILDMGYLTQEELAEKLGKTQSTVANKLRLLNLDEEVQEALLETKISERHARSLLKLTKKEDQIKMLQRIITERLTVRRTDEEIGKMMNENRNIEILDLGEENQILQENAISSMNMPTSPIVEDVAPVIQSQNVVDQTPINPGFMDVEKIEKEAEEINPIQPTADMDALLQPAEPAAPSPQITSNPFDVSMEIEEDNTSAEAMLKPGKFFNLADLEETEKSEIVPPTEPVVENNILTSPVVEQIEPEVQNTYFSEQPEVQNSNFITEFETENQILPEKPTPIIPVNPEPLVQTPIVETTSVPSYSELDAQLYGLDESVANSTTVVQMPENNMKAAIDIIREASGKLESLGFVIETEEYDFEDMYQAIFKINKK